MPGTHFAMKSARRPELDRWVLRYVFEYSSMASSTILPQTTSPIRPPWWQKLLFIPADQLLLFFTLRTGRSTTLGLPDITVPEFSHRFDESQLALSANRKIFMMVEMSRNVQSGNTQNLKSMVIQRSFPKWSVAERRKTAAASDQAAVCACAHSRYFTGGSPSGLRV